jgi:hypothetical protein
VVAVAVNVAAAHVVAPKWRNPAVAHVKQRRSLAKLAKKRRLVLQVARNLVAQKRNNITWFFQALGCLYIRGLFCWGDVNHRVFAESYGGHSERHEKVDAGCGWGL